MEPEIARRCKSCGAAIRQRSAFCPQCGTAQAEEGATAEDATAAQASAPVAATESAQRKQADSGSNAETIAPAAASAEAPVKTQEAARTEAPAPERVRAQESTLPVAPVENMPRVEAAAPGALTASDALAAKQPRIAAAKTRDVADDGGVRPRAEKLRRASNVVLDEAAADPSLRFVLVATALIILSLLLLLLGRIL